MEQKEEEANWLAGAVEKRIPLVELKPDSAVPGDVELMNETYEALNVKSFAKLRLNQLIKRLQKEQENERVQKEALEKPQAPPSKKKLKEDLVEVFNANINSDNPEYQEALGKLKTLAVRYIDSEFENARLYRYPAVTSLHLPPWGAEQMGSELNEKSRLIAARLEDYQPNDRRRIVIGVRLGSGFGKTYALTEAPYMLHQPGLYVTYNMEQDLREDKKAPGKCLLIRLVLTLLGCKQKRSCAFLLENQELVGGATEEGLMGLFVFAAKQHTRCGPFVIGVDEVKLLEDEAAKLVVSTLGNIAVKYYREARKSMCTILVSSLATAVFETKSGRSVENWVPPKPTYTTLQQFAATLPEDFQEEAMALANAICGRHMRSLVIAFPFISKKKSGCSVQDLFDEMKDNLGNKVTPGECRLIRQHVSQSINTKDTEHWEELEVFTDDSYAVPPVYIKFAFEKENSLIKGRLDKLLHSFSLFDANSGKHLENVAKRYDLFRAALKLRVVPGSATVRLGNNCADDEDADWYYKLKFRSELSESTENLLKTEPYKVKGKTRYRVVTTGVTPQPDKYYHPGNSIHPWVDRAYVGIHETSKAHCLVLAQDKVNQNNFSDACKGLNNAAMALLGLSDRFVHALLIVNFIGATPNTTFQEALEWPHILVRGKEEVRDYYSANFADMVWFARERHLISK